MAPMEQLEKKLLDAARLDDLETVKSLLKAGAHINARDDNGQTILHTLAKSSHSAEIVALLHQCHADLNAIDNQGQTPLAIALQNLKRGHVLDSSFDNPFIHYLINHADMNLYHNGQTYLEIACEVSQPYCNESIIVALMEKTQDINHQDRYGDTVLHTMMGNAAHTYFKIFQCVNSFVKNGGNLNLQNHQGNTAAHVAMEREDSAALDALYAVGANMGVKNNAGKLFEACLPEPDESEEAYGFSYRLSRDPAMARNSLDEIVDKIIDKRDKKIEQVFFSKPSFMPDPNVASASILPDPSHFLLADANANTGKRFIQP